MLLCVTLCLVLGLQLNVLSLSSTWSRSLAMQGFHNTHRRSCRAVPPEKLGFLFAYLSTLSSSSHALVPPIGHNINLSNHKNVLRSLCESCCFSNFAFNVIAFANSFMKLAILTVSAIWKNNILLLIAPIG